MNERKEKSILHPILSLLERSGLGNKNERVVVTPLAGDGSLRRFSRLRLQNNTTLIAVLPPKNDARGMAEAAAAWSIAGHLHTLGIPVPEPLAFDERIGLILCEDLGDTRLYDLIHDKSLPVAQNGLGYYKQAVQELARMQVSGSRGFDPRWCWDTPCYDHDVMIERESYYFLNALCIDYLHLEPDVQGIEREFAALAEQASEAPARFFLHRDFQSRNIMIKEDRVRFVDFQGGRQGPLAYDLASLLIDPYAGLEQTLQDELIMEYMKALQVYISYSPEQFIREFHCLALQRNLQVLGAFAFLYHRQGKDFFRPFIRPALLSLNGRLSGSERKKYPALYRLVEHCIEKNEKYDL